MKTNHVKHYPDWSFVGPQVQINGLEIILDHERFWLSQGVNAIQSEFWTLE